MGGLGGLGGLPGLGFPGQIQRTSIQYSFENTQNDLVTITLPDGTRETFDMGFTGVTYNYAAPPLATTSLFFVPLPGTGTTGTLEALTNNNVIVTPAQVGPVTFIDASTGQVYNPTLWKYTDQAGTVFIISTANGVQSITNSNGVTDTYSASGIQASNGMNLTIARDSQGRVTSITEPDGSQIQYGYDFYGDLVTVTDAGGNVTRYTYDTNHQLESVYDPLGRQGTRNEYDSSGRLIAEVDSQGHETTFDHVMSQNTESQTDALGNTTTYVYDDQGNVIELTDPLGDVTESTFDDLHHVLSQTQILADGTKLTTSYTYNATGQALSKTDPMGETTYYTYDSHGNVLSMKDPLGIVTSSTFDANGNLQSQTDANGNTTTFVANIAGEVLSSTDPMGYTTLYGYNILGEQTSSQDPAGTQFSTAFNANGLPTATGFLWVNPTDPSNTQELTQQTTYNANGQATMVVAPNGTVTQSNYNADGELIGLTDNRGNWTTYVYNTTGKEIETLYPDGTVDRTVYDALGRAIYVTARYNPSSGSLPDATHTIYDAAGRVIETQQLSGVLIDVTTTPDGNSSSAFVSAGSVLNQTSSEYDAAGRAIETTDASGLTTTYEYDLDGRPTKVTIGNSQTTTDQYDADGRRIEMTDPSGAVTRYVFDANGNVIETIYADGTTTESTYDKDNRQISFTDQAGQTTNYQYDATGNLTAVILPAVPNPQNGGALTRPEYTYTYDVYNDELTETDPLGHVTTFTYTIFGQEVGETLPDGESDSTTYNLYGQVLTQTDFKGQITATSYDDMGRPVTKSLYSSAAALAAGSPGDTIQTTYDSTDRAISVTDQQTGEIQYTYNSQGQITTLSTPEGTINYTYDPISAALTETSTTYTDIKYAYNSIEQLSTVTTVMVNGVPLSTPLVATYTYDISGALTSLTEPNGVTTSYTYDVLHRLIAVKETNSSGQVLSSDSYTLDAVGRRVADDEFQLQSNGSLDEVKITWAFDALGRLVTQTSTDITGGRPDLTFSTSFTYDLDGNILSQTTTTSSGTVTTTFTYNGDDELVQTQTTTGTTVDYLYDANGSLIEKMENGQVINTYSYDLQNRMNESTAYSTNSGGQAVVTSSTYAYDIAGNLVNQDTTVTVKGSLPTTTDVFFLNDPKNATGNTQVLEEHNSQGTPIETYVWGNQALFQTGTSGQSQFFLQDGLGSTRLLTDMTGQVIARYDYDAYGNALGFDPATAATAILYAGERFDATTGQYDMGARSYDPATGRFSQRDSFDGNSGNPQSQNKYAYVQGDPIDQSDPTGYGNIDALLGIVVHIKIGQQFITQYPFTLNPFGPYNTGSGAANRTLGRIFGSTIQGAYDALRGFTEGLDDGTGPLPIVLPDIVLLGLETIEVLAAKGFENFLALRPDLVAFSSLPPQVWEIKPITEAGQGLIQLGAYVVLMNYLTYAIGGLGATSPWIPGRVGVPPFGYTAPPVYFNGRNVTQPQSNNGLILYDNSEAYTLDALVQVATSAFTVVWGAVSLFDPLVAPLLIAIQEAVDATLSAAIARITATATAAYAGIVPVLTLLTQIGPRLQLQNLEAGASGPNPPGLSSTSYAIASNDPELSRLLAEAENNWSAALGAPPPLSFGIVVEPLAPGLLGQSEVTTWNSAGRPLSGIIFLSPDADGKGWYVGSDEEDSSAFLQSPNSTVSVAAAGSAAYGHYDLLTTLEHEIGHILAFDTSNPGYESRLQTMNGSQVFVGSDFTLPVAPGGELDPNFYPADVMAATLATGVRKLPAENELQVVRALWGNTLKPPAAPIGGFAPAAVVQAVQTAVQSPVPPVQSAPEPVTAVLDRAIAALTLTTTAIGTVPSSSSQAVESPGPSATNYRDGHRVIVEANATGVAHHRTKSARPVSSSADSKDHAKHLLTAPDGSLAVQFSGQVSKNRDTTRKAFAHYAWLRRRK